ncbi:MAG TPA: hypothetical protein VIS48_15005 [Candidatus Kryptonia bacterium]
MIRHKVALNFGLREDSAKRKPRREFMKQIGTTVDGAAWRVEAYLKVWALTRQRENGGNTRRALWKQILGHPQSQSLWRESVTWTEARH